MFFILFYGMYIWVCEYFKFFEPFKLNNKENKFFLNKNNDGDFGGFLSCSWLSTLLWVDVLAYDSLWIATFFGKISKIMGLSKLMWPYIRR